MQLCGWLEEAFEELELNGKARGFAFLSFMPEFSPMKGRSFRPVRERFQRHLGRCNLLLFTLTFTLKILHGSLDPVLPE